MALVADSLEAWKETKTKERQMTHLETFTAIGATATLLTALAIIMDKRSNRLTIKRTGAPKHLHNAQVRAQMEGKK